MHSYLKGHPALIRAVQRLEHKKCDQFELYFSRRTSTQIQAKDQKVDSLSRAEDVGLAIRIVKHNRLGFSFTTSLDDSSIDRATENAVVIASQMPEDPHVGLFSFGSAVYPEVDSLDSRGLAVPLEEKIDMAMRLEQACLKTDPRVKGLRTASVSEIRYETHMVDSSGEHIHHDGSLFTSSVQCKAELDGDAQMGSDFAFSNYLDALDVESVGRNAAIKATELLKAGQAPTFSCPAVLRNEVVAQLVGFLSSSFSIEEMEKKRSLLAGRVGDKVFGENITLIDDGLLSGGFASHPFDAEGIPCSKAVLVDGGVFQEPLYDQYYARKLGKEPGGTTSRGIKSPPTISASNLYLKPGKAALTKLMGGIDRGVMITSLMGLHTANPVTGDFSVGASGILIEKGKPARPIKGFAIAGNIVELFRKMTDIGSDLKWFGSIGAPSVRVSEIAVGGSSV